MNKMLDQYADKIKGSFSFFDRMILNGYILPFISTNICNTSLYKLEVLHKDFKEYFKNVTELIKTNIEKKANELGRPVKFLQSPQTNKEAEARKALEENPVDEGLICVLKALEVCCTNYTIYDKKAGHPVVKQKSGKCEHYYLYYQDKEYGFMFVKIQTWFPFTIQIYINGRELMKHVFDEHDITYKCYDNSFTEISDVEKAQELADKFDSAKLCRRLDHFAKTVNPFLDTVIEKIGQGYYWCVNQCEYATDIMFKERSFLEDIYPSLVGHAFHDFSCTDVFTFMGRKLSPQFQGEAVSDYKKRPVGCRVKFRLKSNSIKMYDKSSVLRVETTINDPKEFKIFGSIHHRDGTEEKVWKPMGKGISNLYRYAEISKAANKRFIDALVDIIPVNSVIQEIGDICHGKEVKGKRISGFNVWAPNIVLIMETVCDGRFLINGFRNKDIRNLIFPNIGDWKKQSSLTSRILKKLRTFGLVRKNSRSRQYHVSSKGRRIMGALIELRRQQFPVLAAKNS